MPAILEKLKSPLKGDGILGLGIVSKVRSKVDEIRSKGPRLLK